MSGNSPQDDSGTKLLTLTLEESVPRGRIERLILPHKHDLDALSLTEGRLDRRRNKR